MYINRDEVSIDLIAVEIIFFLWRKWIAGGKRFLHGAKIIQGHCLGANVILIENVFKNCSEKSFWKHFLQRFSVVFKNKIL